MNTDELNFDLPAELIAQAPTPDRAASRLLHYRRDSRTIDHRQFAELPALLRRGDLLVFNDARVVPARFTLIKPTGGVVDGLLLGPAAGGEWRAMLQNLGPLRPELRLRFAAAPDVGVQVVGKGDGGEYRIQFIGLEGTTPNELLARIGRMPLPPYIKRDKQRDDRDELDRQRYQTVYARREGSIAAPTAGLHFTPELLSRLDEAGIERAVVTLHVGLGTFKPVTAERLEDHAMHAEEYEISSEAAAALNRARRAGRRIIAVGTTSARVLESQPAEFTARRDQTRIFIYPPYQWKHVGGLITNFHLPRSTLIALVAALVGLDEQRRIYGQAIALRYRFFSYGDAMLVE